MSQDITDEELSGPKIDRRTMMKLVGAGGVSLTAALAGCTGGNGGGGGQQTTTTQGSGDNQTTTQKQTTKKQKQSGGGGKMTAAWHIDEILDLDPVVNSTGQFEQVSMNLYTSLVRTTEKFEVKPNLAKDWTVKDQAKTFEFTLKKGAKFQGEYGEITAKDVQDTIYRSVNAKGSTSKPKLKKVKRPLRGTGVEVLGDYKVRINLKSSFAPFIKAMTKAGGACNVHPVKAVEKMGRQKFKTDPVGSGPFKVESHKVGQRIVLKPHEGFHRTDDQGNKLPYLDEVEVKTMPESSTMVNALLAGDVQFANQIPTENLDKLKQGKSKVLKSPSAGWIALYLNPKKEIFDSPKKRRAIAKVFNSREFVKQTFFGNQKPAIGPIGPAHGPFFRSYENKPNYQKYEPKKGEKMLEETGIKGKEFVIHTQGEDMRRAKGYKKQLNPYFDVKIKPVDTSTYLDLLDGVHKDTPKKKGYFSAGWGSDIDIAVDTTMYFFFKSPDKGGAFNDMLYSDPDVDKWLEEQRKATSTQKRVKLMQKVEDRVMKESPCIFTHHIVPYQAIGKNVKGYTPHPFRRDFENIQLK